MSYFIKNNKVHKYPTENGCNAEKGDKKEYSKIPTGYEKCDRCFDLPR